VKPQGDFQVVCEECEQTITFPASAHGSVQDCPHCGAYVDALTAEELAAHEEGQQEAVEEYQAEGSDDSGE
jgi:hypothetical protein